MKKLKHIWKYLTSPMYRTHVDLMMSQIALDAMHEQMKENLRRAAMPPLFLKYMDEKGLDDVEFAAQLYKTQYGIRS